jgi:hypothetical protein
METMKLLRRQGEIPFYQRLILPWEEKRRLDPFLVWSGSYRWFKSGNIVPLERYRSSEEMERIRANVLRRPTMYLKYHRTNDLNSAADVAERSNWSGDYALSCC